MIELLASAVDPQLSGSWVLQLVAKLFAGFAILIGAAYAAYKKGQANAPTSTERTLKSPVPTVTIKTEPVWASREELAKVQHELKEPEARECFRYEERQRQTLEGGTG